MTWAAIVAGGVAVAGTTASMIVANQNRADAPDNSLSYKSAQLLRADYDDWKKNFAPIEQNLLKQISYNNPSVLPNALDKTEDTVEKSYQSMGGVLERQAAGLGIDQTQQQEATGRRLLDLNKNKTMASAENNTRANIRKMDESILLGTVRR
jgi:hypothetical protein